MKQVLSRSWGKAEVEKGRRCRPGRGLSKQREEEMHSGMNNEQAGLTNIQQEGARGHQALRPGWGIWTSSCWGEGNMKGLHLMQEQGLSKVGLLTCEIGIRGDNSIRKP